MSTRSSNCSVLRSGERLRLTCRLIDSRTEDLLWSESFDRNLHDVLSLHDEVTRAIASSVRAAANEYLTSLEVGRHSPEECSAIRRAFQERGLPGLHEEDLSQSVRRWDGWHGLAFDIAALQAGLGHITDSLDWLERTCDARSGRMIWLNSGTSACRIAPYFDKLRSEPRFRDLLERVHLPT